MINVVFVLLAKRAFSDDIKGVNSKDFSLAQLACSKSPFFQKTNVAYNI